MFCYLHTLVIILYHYNEQKRYYYYNVYLHTLLKYWLWQCLIYLCFILTLVGTFFFAEDWLQSEEATERRTKRTEENKNKEEKTCNNSNDKSIDEHKMVPVYVLKFVYYSFCI